MYKVDLPDFRVQSSQLQPIQGNEHRCTNTSNPKPTIPPSCAFLQDALSSCNNQHTSNCLSTLEHKQRKGCKTYKFEPGTNLSSFISRSGQDLLLYIWCGSALSGDKSLCLPSINQSSACTAQVEVHCVIILNSWYDWCYEFQKYEKVPVQKRWQKLETGKEGVEAFINCALKNGYHLST